MMKKLLYNAIFSAILLIVMVGMEWNAQGKDSAMTFVSEWWWVFVLLPLAIRAYFWFQGLKRKAFDAGYNATSNAFKKDTKQ